MAISLRRSNFLWYFTGVFIFCGCHDEISLASIEVIDLPNKEPIISMISDSTNFYVSQGIYWTPSQLYNVTTEQLSPIPNTILGFVQRDQDILALGMNSLVGNILEDTIKVFPQPSYEIYRAGIGIGTSTLIVGGKSYKFGFVQTMDTSGFMQDRFDFLQELRDIAMVGDNLVVVGFGAVYTKSLQEQGWTKSKIDGDFFIKAIPYDDQWVYLIGQEGSLILWNIKKNLWSTYQVKPRITGRINDGLLLEATIYLAGDNGSLWSYNINSQEWQFSRISKFNLSAIESHQGSIYIGSDGGHLYKLSP